MQQRRPTKPWSLDLDALDRARILANLSYEQLGRRANVHRLSLAVIFQGRRQPTVGTAHALARALNLDPAAVITFDRADETA